MAHYELNGKGYKALDKWDDIYQTEMDRLDRETPGHGRGGWSILDEEGLLKNINDWVEMLVCFYGNYAIPYTYDVQNHDSDDVEYVFGYSFKQVRDMLKEYFDEEE